MIKSKYCMAVHHLPAKEMTSDNGCENKLKNLMMKLLKGSGEE